MNLAYNDYLQHHGIKGQKWGVRRYQNPDGTLTAAGRRRYSQNNSLKNELIKDYGLDEDFKAVANNKRLQKILMEEAKQEFISYKKSKADYIKEYQKYVKSDDFKKDLYEYLDLHMPTYYKDYNKDGMEIAISDYMYGIADNTVNTRNKKLEKANTKYLNAENKYNKKVSKLVDSILEGIDDYTVGFQGEPMLYSSMVNNALENYTTDFHYVDAGVDYDSLIKDYKKRIN